jgi:hypothetical protein
MKPILLITLLALASTAHAFTGRASNTYQTDGTQADVQNALNQAKDGDIIVIPPGTFTWTTTVTAKTGVTISGAGVGSTVIVNTTGLNARRVSLTIACDGAQSRVQGITFSGQWGLATSGDNNSAPFRIDDCAFDVGTAQGIMVETNGNGPGLIDHCTFSGGGASEMIHQMGNGAGNNAGWLDDVNPGSANAVYIENCTFSKNPFVDPYFWGTSAIQCYYGARTVVRHCKLNYCQLDCHGPPQIGARWYEFYENTYYLPDSATVGSQSHYMHLRGGSGVVFNNHVGTPQTANRGKIEIIDEAGGPVSVWTARGIDQNPSPIYLWGNDSLLPVQSASANLVSGRDFFVSATQPSSMKRWQKTSDNSNTTYSYVPYVYPHPLNDGDPNAYEPGPTKPKPTPTPTPAPTPTPTPPPQPTPTPIIINTEGPTTITIQPRQ